MSENPRYDQSSGAPQATETVGASPVFAAVIHGEKVERVLHDMAGWWIERGWEPDWPSQIDLQMIAQAHAARGETRVAIETLELALGQRGPMDAFIRSYLAQLREQEAKSR